MRPEKSAGRFGGVQVEGNRCLIKCGNQQHVILLRAKDGRREDSAAFGGVVVGVVVLWFVGGWLLVFGILFGWLVG